MNIYLIENDNVAIQLKQLLKLNSECVKVHWSRSINNIPDEVIDSFEIIESFVEDRLRELCNETTFFSSLTEEEEDGMMALLRQAPELRLTLGSGVIMAGEEKRSIGEMLEKHDGLKSIRDAIKLDKNVIIF